uniref:putative oxidoreductase C-terminal domain-containing protein n=1 Tax=uncultured Draconibacterium sp. TaxID=1573823 RepID=UPI003216E9C5
MKIEQVFIFLVIASILNACGGGSKSTELKEKQSKCIGAKGEVKIMTLAPGHFHAALVQKTMYDQVDTKVHVYAPEGRDVQDYLKRIHGFNIRAENPTAWEVINYTGADYLKRMLIEKPGNVMVVSGNNAKKTSYIKAAVTAGINVFADKPLVVNSSDFAILEETFKTAEAKGVLVYDIMTDRYEVTNIIQRELSKIPNVFGELREGTVLEPAITIESVHHFFKYVSGSPIVRPAWFFDTEQQGEGIIDVTTHQVDLIQWMVSPEKALLKEDVDILYAKRWATVISKDEFKRVTGLEDIPKFLHKDIKDGKLHVFANGEIIYKLKGKVVRVSVSWNYQAQEGAADTYYSIMRGSICDIIIKQGIEEGFNPTVYIKANIDEGIEAFEQNLQKAIGKDLAVLLPGLKIERQNHNIWVVNISQKYQIGHEAHFRLVTEKYLAYLKSGRLPEWEVSNMITKYYTTTKALEMAFENKK